MKTLITLSLVLFASISNSFAQDKLVLGDIGYTEAGKDARAVMHSNLLTDGSYTYLDFRSGYGIVWKNEQAPAFAELIASYRSIEGNEMQSLGTFVTHAVTGVSETEKIGEPGSYETTYQKGTEIELKYDGEDLWIFIPETKFLRYTAPAKEIRIFKDYVEALHTAFQAH